MDYVVEVHFSDEDPNLRKAENKKGRDIYVYCDDVNLDDFDHRIYKI